ncbi:MAG TPA: type I DNA topoisomerase [Candidatus Borkfalkia excrementigallinarum]|uniref:DNA topoisomerase 1 n=1 Tax=Candidatus Borkfalkia excrementigallinarum TaxID=2838506 RepID=A0A9D1ZUZ5_9FIRM|nr:type I DNA topoisomerase [Candidatus Borkfalkia excrementigallinarum]
MDLIIVESPSKAKTIAKYLKGKYRVDASGGHVRDLPEKRLGVDIDKNFEPSYVINPDKKQVIKRLSEEAAKAENVYLATDPDREGEAISWHLKNVLKLKDGKNRIEFNEISPAAVTNALKNPREIDYNLVDAQQARRVLDRLVGYKLSPLLCKRIHSGLSAGRVQSVALRLIVDREREIQAFVPEEYWNLTAELQDKPKAYAPFKALLSEKAGKKYKPKNAEENEAVRAELDGKPYIVSEIKKSVAKSHAPAPFTTSTLQQDASNKFGMTSPEVMLVAQHLYEGMDTEKEGHIALVTYIRTDSVRVSAEAQAKARDYIAGRFGKEYIPEKPNFYKSKKDAQDAHECIRPIDMNRTPESLKGVLDKKHYNVYKLIYERFMASQMSEAVYNSVQMKIKNGDYGFKASGRTLKFAGFTAVYQDIKKDKEDEEGVNAKLLPDLKEGDELDLIKLTSEQKFTKPPQRYTDASLVKAMEDKGIGRPSTYASIISVLTKRKYVTKDGKYMVPTEVAFQITDLLMKYFTDIMDVGFTAKMEDKLDNIEEGGTDWRKIIADFYPPFAEKLVFAANDGDEMTDILCEKCGHPMIRKSGRYGKFLACSNYPACSNIKSEGMEISATKCPKCGANMVVKSGKYGKFLACPNYPECNAILPFDSEVSKEKCPKCGELMIYRNGRYGKYLSCPKCGTNQPISETAGVCPVCGAPTRRLKSKAGKIFYSCSKYPSCKFMSWDMPTGEKCPKCGKYLVKKGKQIKCSSCNYAIDVPEKEETEEGKE